MIIKLIGIRYIQQSRVEYTGAIFFQN